MKKVTIFASILLALTLVSCGNGHSGQRSDKLLARSALTEEQVTRVKNAYPRSACAFALPWTEAYLDAGRNMRTAVKLGFSEILVVGHAQDGTPIAVKKTPSTTHGYQVLYVVGLTDKLGDAQKAWSLYGRIQRQPSPILPVSASGRFCPQRPMPTAEAERSMISAVRGGRASREPPRFFPAHNTNCDLRRTTKEPY